MTAFDAAAWKAQADALIDALPEKARAPMSGVIAQTLRAMLRDEEPGERFKLHRAAEALQPQPPVDWIVDRLFSAGSVSLIVGEAKSKKTYSLIDCAVAVALGEKWLEFETKQGTVLVIDEESGERRLNRRLGDTMRGHDADPNTPIFYVSLAGVNLRNSADTLIIEDLIKDTGARLMIIDALIDVIGDADENDASQVQAAFHTLRTIAENTKVAIVVIHHAGKNGGYRGSSAMKGAVDLLLMVESKPDSLNIEFDVAAPRDVEPFKFAAVANFGEEIFNLSPSVPTQKCGSLGKGQRYVLRYLQEHGGQAPLTEIGAHADSCSESTAKNAAHDLVEKGYTQRIDKGGKGSVAIYALTDLGKSWKA